MDQIFDAVIWEPDTSAARLLAGRTVVLVERERQDDSGG